jgi:hypothetical protein
LRFAVDFLAADFLAAVFVFRFAADFLPADFLAAVFVFRFAADFLAAVFRFAVDFLAVDFRAVFFFAAVFFLAPDFLAVDFFFAVDFFRAPEERELLEERDDERVVAGTATVRSVSALSVASPIADSPHAGSASAAGSFHEPALDVFDASPVPLQSSWVMYDLLSRIARARFPTTWVSNVQCGQHRFFRTLPEKENVRESCVAHVCCALRTASARLRLAESRALFVDACELHCVRTMPATRTFTRVRRGAASTSARRHRLHVRRSPSPAHRGSRAAAA